MAGPNGVPSSQVSLCNTEGGSPAVSSQTILNEHEQFQLGEKAHFSSTTADGQTKKKAFRLGPRPQQLRLGESFFHR